MAGTSILRVARAALSVESARTAELVAALPDTAVPIPGSGWTIREAAVHLAIVGSRFAGMVHGERNQYPALSPADYARRNDQLNADIPESDPAALARLISAGTDALLAAAGSGHDQQEVLFDHGIVVTVPHLLGIALAEHTLHGSDMAAAARRPWPVDPRHAALGLLGRDGRAAGCPSPTTSPDWHSTATNSGGSIR